jgi:undecaprenyl-diphosphatase
MDQLDRVDLALYRAVAATRTPVLDRWVCGLSRLADRSKVWILVGSAIALVGGRGGRRAAVAGLLAAAASSAVVNLLLKLVGRRTRPDPGAAAVAASRHVPMPASPSFPSGHTASAFAFAAAQAGAPPPLAAPVWVLAAAVGYSRVHTGVHYPGDVVAGALVGGCIGVTVASVTRAISGTASAPQS